MRRLLVGIAALVCGVASPRGARANGRFPYAQQLVETPGNPARLFLRTTYGILETSDTGKHWHWICEDSVGYSGSEDPSFGVTANGTVIGGMFHGLATSTDNGCNWAFVDHGSDAGLDSLFVSDLAVDPANPAQAVALVSMGDFTGKFRNQVWKTTDNAATWTQLGANLDTSAIAFTLDVSAADPQRIYVSASFSTDGGTQGGILRSKDGGQSWERADIPGSVLENPPFIGAVDPGNADALYVRLNGADQDALLYSADAGGTWKEMIKKQAELFGFALSPDGKTVLAGYDKPDQQGAPYDATALGVWAAHPPDFTFTKISDGPISCLAWTAQGVYACGSQFVQGFELGLSKDGGKTFATLLQLSQTEGPLDCPAGTTTAAKCPALWPKVCNSIGRCGVDDGGAGATGAAGSGGQSGSASTSPGSGCGCQLPAGGRGALGALAGALGLAIFLARREKKRS